MSFVGVESAWLRDLAADVTFVVSWAACVAICVPFINLLTDHSIVVCVIPSLPLGSLLFWGSVSAVNLWCAMARASRSQLKHCDSTSAPVTSRSY
jgi:hypothetical protein